jgi:glycosyltransferase involved in cell wall biosynthesis
VTGKTQRSQTQQKGSRRPAARAQRVSLCIIAKDEARDIAGCIASAAGAVDEIVVVDTGSSDATKEIAAAAGAIVADFPWRDDFAAARNCALEHATGDWILVLDADERLAPGGAEKIRAAIRNNKCLGYRLEIASDIGGSVPQRVYLIRLYRRRPELRYVRRIHESLNEAISDLARGGEGDVLDLDVRIDHSGYAPERFVSLKKRERNIRLHRLTVDERPDDAYAWYRYGDELRAVDLEQAADALARAWNVFLRLPAAERPRHVYAPEIAALRALLALEAGDTAMARSLADEGAREAGSTPNSRHVRAGVLRTAGDFAGALAEYLWLLDFGQRRSDAPIQPGITTTFAALGAAECLESLGENARAEECYKKALAFDPKCFHAARGLALAIQRRGDAAGGRRALDEYLQRNPNDGEAWSLSAKFALDAGSPEAALKRYQIAASAFDAPDSVLRDCASCQAILGDLKGALKTMSRIRDPRTRAALDDQLSKST